MSAKKSVFRLFSTLLVLVLTLSIAGPANAAAVASSKPAKAAKAARLLQFTSAGHALGFSTQAMYAATGSHALRVDFLGAANIQPQADSSASPSGGQDTAASLNHVSYPGLWDGIDLVYTATMGSIYTTTYTLAPGADARSIRLRYNAPLALNKNGSLRIAFETGVLTESAPIAWQVINGKRMAVDVAFRVRGQEVGFTLGAYNPRHALMIDPSVVWNTFLGSSASDAGTAIAVDGSGNLFVAGTSSATWGIPVRVYTSNSDAFVAKLDAATGSLIWNAFLGGTGADVGNGIAIDGSGNVFVTGASAATWGSPMRLYTATGNDAFAAKLNSSGGLLWNTFLGGTGTDTGSSIAVDGSGNVFVAGFSSATWGSPLRAYTATGNDASIAKLDTSGGLLWNTFLGASGTDSGNAITVDGSGNVFVAGRSAAAWSCPVACTVLAYTSSFEAFVARLDAATGSLTWNTFLGASGSDEGNAIALDGSGNIYVAGYSSTTWGSPVLPYTASTFDAFAAKLDPSGNLLWNTFLGGSGQDLGKSIAVDGSGNIYVSGNSTATWGSPRRAYTASEDGFAARLNSSGGLTVSTFLGSSGIDGAYSIDVDGSGNPYVAGSSGATWGSPVRLYTASNDAFAAKLDLNLTTVALSSTAAPDGFVLESSETSAVGGAVNTAAATFNLGDDAARRQLRGFLSFATGSLPDTAIISDVTLKLRKASVTGGGNPVSAFQGIFIDLKAGFFGSSSALQAADFQAAAGKTLGPANPVPVSNVYSISLLGGKTFINKLATGGGLTQIRLRFKLDDNNNATANYLSLFAGNAAAANRPQLVITYYVP